MTFKATTQRTMLAVCFLPGLFGCVGGTATGLDLGDDPGRSVGKTSATMTAPPPELRNGTARDAATRP